MRKFCLVVFLVCNCIAAHAQEYDLTLLPYRKGKLWGYSDTTGKMVIQPQFTEAQLFQGKLTMAKIDSYYCVIDRSGKVIYKNTQFTSVRDGGATYLATQNSYTEQLFDAKARPLTKAYNRIGGFNKYGYADVTAGYTKHGLMDRSYHEVIAPEYGSIEFYGPALIKVYEDRKGYGLIDLKTGKKVPAKYGQIYPQRDGLFMVLSGRLYGFIDENGKEVIPAKYWKATPSDVELQERYNESTYEDFNLDGFYEGLAVVIDPDTKKAGYINETGRVAIPFTFDKAYGFCRGRAWVQSGGHWGIIDRKGKYVLQPVYKAPFLLYAKELEALDCFREGVIPAAADSLYGYVDSNGKVAISFRFHRAMPFYQGLAAAYIEDKMGFIDHSGSWVIPPIYEWAEGVGQYNRDPFVDGYAIALKPGGGYVIINKQGKQLVPIEFDKTNGVSFEYGLGEAAANGKRYLFLPGGDIIYTSPADHQLSLYARHLIYSYGDKCFINIRTGTHYCD